MPDEDFTEPMPPMPVTGPGATVAAVAGGGVAVVGWLFSIWPLVALGVLGALCAWLYANKRDKRDGEIWAREVVAWEDHRDGV